MNVLSVLLLIRIGAIVHFEEGNSYFQPNEGAPKIPFLETNSLFQLEIGRGALLFPAQDTIDVAVGCQCFATSGSLKLWHERMRPIRVQELPPQNA